MYLLYRRNRVADTQVGVKFSQEPCLQTVNTGHRRRTRDTENKLASAFEMHSVRMLWRHFQQLSDAADVQTAVAYYLSGYHAYHDSTSSKLSDALLAKALKRQGVLHRQGRKVMKMRKTLSLVYARNLCYLSHLF